MPAPRTCTHQLHSSPALLCNNTSTQKKTRYTRHSNTLPSHAWFLTKSDLNNEKTQDTQLSSGRASATTTQQLRSGFLLIFSFSFFFPPFPTLDFATSQIFSHCLHFQRAKKTQNPTSSLWALSTAQFTQPTYLQAPDNTAQRSTAQHSGLAKASGVSQQVHCHC